MIASNVATLKMCVKRALQYKMVYQNRGITSTTGAAVTNTRCLQGLIR